MEAALGQVYERIEGGNTGAEWADDDVDDCADEANRPRDHEHDQPQDAPCDISHDVRSTPPSTNTMVKLPKELTLIVTSGNLLYCEQPDVAVFVTFSSMPSSDICIS